MNYAEQALAARAQSASELRTRLVRRAMVKEDVEVVLAYFKELGYLNDQKFAGLFADWRRDNQGLGQARVFRDLMSRKVAPSVAKEAVAEAYKEVDEIALIEGFLRRKYRGKDLSVVLAEPKNMSSAFRKLRLAGFGSSNSIKVLKQFAAGERAEEIAEGLESLEDEEERAEG
jgi:regulatory protein